MKSVVSAVVTAALIVVLWPAAPASTAPPSDLDAFMAEVLERRNDAWRALHDYILSERESFELRGPGDIRLFGGLREYTWFVRDGYLIRSPLRFDGVAPGARERQDYEHRWLREEQEREKRRAEQDAKKRATPAAGSAAAPDGAAIADTDGASLVKQGFEPRFISEAYFMQFKFDPGNYYLAGRETLEGRPVLRIEYYPTKLYQDDKDRRREARDREHERERKADDLEDDLERKFNKVALITLWIDPAERQIVKYTFDNTELNFIPGRWLVRVGDVRVSMTMGQPIGKVWLPRAIEAHAGLTLANGDYDGRYRREFFDYREGEVKARIRSYSPVER